MLVLCAAEARADGGFRFYPPNGWAKLWPGEPDPAASKVVTAAYLEQIRSMNYALSAINPAEGTSETVNVAVRDGATAITDDTLADLVYVRHAYTPDDIVWNHRFVDVLSVTPNGRRVVDLTRFHDTCPIA